MPSEFTAIITFLKPVRDKELGTTRQLVVDFNFKRNAKKKKHVNSFGLLLKIFNSMKKYLSISDLAQVSKISVEQKSSVLHDFLPRDGKYYFFYASSGSQKDPEIEEWKWMKKLILHRIKPKPKRKGKKK